MNSEKVEEKKIGCCKRKKKYMHGNHRAKCAYNLCHTYIFIRNIEEAPLISFKHLNRTHNSPVCTQHRKIVKCVDMMSQMSTQSNRERYGWWRLALILCHRWCIEVMFFLLGLMLFFILVHHKICDIWKRRRELRKSTGETCCVLYIWCTLFPIFSLMWFKILDLVIFISRFFFNIFLYSDLACSFFLKLYEKNGKKVIFVKKKSFLHTCFCFFFHLWIAPDSLLIFWTNSGIRYTSILYIFFFVVFFYFVFFVFVLVYNWSKNHVVPLESFHHQCKTNKKKTHGDGNSVCDDSGSCSGSDNGDISFLKLQIEFVENIVSFSVQIYELREYMLVYFVLNVLYVFLYLPKSK